MKKSDLKTGHLVETRNGDIALVLLGTDRGDVITGGFDIPTNMPQTTWGPLDAYNDDLLYATNSVFGIIPEGDIMKVYGLPNTGNRLLHALNKNERELLWDRDAMRKEDQEKTFEELVK